MISKVLSLLGFAAKSGRLSFGMDPSKTALKRKRSFAVVVASDISQKSKDEISFTAEKNGVSIIFVPITMNELSHAVGKKKCGIISVNDKGFADAVTSHLQKLQGGIANDG